MTLPALPASERGELPQGLSCNECCPTGVVNSLECASGPRHHPLRGGTHRHASIVPAVEQAETQLICPVGCPALAVRTPCRTVRVIVREGRDDYLMIVKGAPQTLRDQASTILPEDSSPLNASRLKRDMAEVPNRLEAPILTALPGGQSRRWASPMRRGSLALTASADFQAERRAWGRSGSSPASRPSRPNRSSSWGGPNLLAPGLRHTLPTSGSPVGAHRVKIALDIAPASAHPMNPHMNTPRGCRRIDVSTIWA